jgi:hypothetical protein
MTSDRDDVEDGKLRGLSRETPSPPQLEDRVVAALRQSGLIAPRHRAPRLWFAAAAAGLFLAGWFGRGMATRPGAMSDQGPLYLLLLSQVHRHNVPPEVDLLQETQDWALGIRSHNQLVRGERLAPKTELVQGTVGGGEPTVREVLGAPPSGFLLVRANSLPEAVALARACPHLRYGGSVTVHEVDTPESARRSGATGPD